MISLYPIIQSQDQNLQKQILTQVIHVSPMQLDQFKIKLMIDFNFAFVSQVQIYPQKRQIGIQGWSEKTRKAL